MASAKITSQDAANAARQAKLVYLIQRSNDYYQRRRDGLLDQPESESEPTPAPRGMFRDPASVIKG